MPHDQWEFPGAHRNLIEHVGVIAAVGLALRRRLVRVKLTWIRNCLAANEKTALLLDLQRREVLGLRGRRGCYWQEGNAQRDQRKQTIVCTHGARSQEEP